MADTANAAGSDSEEKTTIAEDLVVTKYKMASEITNRNKLSLLFFLFNLILNKKKINNKRYSKRSYGQMCAQCIIN